MNNPLAGHGTRLGTLSAWIISLTTLLCAPLWAADDFEPPQLRHQFAPNTTNVFKLTLEMQTEDGKTPWEGNIIAVTTATAKSRATISFETKIRPPSMAMRSPPMYGPYGPVWNPFEFRGIGYGMPLTCQVEVDDRGRVLRSMGEFALAPPFHELYRFLLPMFPEQPGRQWSFRSEQALPADTWGGSRRFPGYYPPMGPGNRSPARMTAERHEDSQVVQVKNHITRIHQELTMESWARIDDTPRWRITGKAEIDFDAAAGQLLSIEMPCTAIWTSETTTRRAPMVLRCQRVAESDLPELLAALKPEMPPNLDEDGLRKLLQDLEVSDPEKKMKAANVLMSAMVSTASPETLALLEERVKTAEPHIRTGMVRILAQNATPAQVPWLLGLMKSSDSSARMEAAKALGRLKEKRAAEPLAEIIAQGSYDQTAIDALKQIGPPAEEAVLTLLQEKHQETRRRACEILQQIGTSRSLEPLRAILLSADENIAMSVRQAIQEIQARLTMIEAGSR